MKSFGQFLQRNSVAAASRLPLVHTTRAHHLRSLGDDNRLIASDCDVFIGEKLNYLFVGRPAYKPISDASEPEYWELPACLVFDFAQITDVRRIFPFDSGGFAKYPSYISRMQREYFEVSGSDAAPERIIGAFFGSAERYFRLQPKDKVSFEREYSLTALDAEIRALHKLALAGPPRSVDDRRFAIEIQTGDIDLAVVKPLAVIAPMIYYEDPEFRKHVEVTWGAIFISYPIYPLSIDAYYAMIYDRIFELYKKLGVI